MNIDAGNSYCEDESFSCVEKPEVNVLEWLLGQNEVLFERTNHRQLRFLNESSSLFE
jgi:hypothetical protein